MLEHDRPCGMLGTWYPTKTSFKNPPGSLIPAVSITVQYVHGTFALNHSLLSPREPEEKKRNIGAVSNLWSGKNVAEIILIYVCFILTSDILQSD